MQIKDLPKPVTAAKADWLPGTRWLGFTPSDASGDARERCRAIINSQMKDGYVLEYVTLKFGEPNAGFENNPRLVHERQLHRDVAGRLLAVHRLRPSSLPLIDILGEEEFSSLQDVWADGDKRYRWSVAFPIIESYSIVGRPLANEVLGVGSMQRVFGHPSGTLRPLIDAERAQIAGLEIEPRPTENIWLGIADEARMAERSEISPQTQRLIDHDLSSAMEGMTEEQKRQVRKRAALLAERFVRLRASERRLVCDDCGLDAFAKAGSTGVSPRSLLDVHHKNPLDEGVRLTTIIDFALLCPSCHRFLHAVARIQRREALRAD